MPPKRVLLIDDDENFLGLLSDVVAHEGFVAETAIDGQQGLAAIEKSPPDLVILDMMLPHMGGFELLSALQEGKLAYIPVIVITGYHKDPATIDIIRGQPNVQEFLAKPLDMAVLGQALHRLLD